MQDGVVEVVFVVVDPPAALSESVRRWVEVLSLSLPWVLGPSTLVDEEEVIEAETAESEAALERARQSAAIIAEGAQNIVWPIGRPFAEPPPVERRAAAPEVKRHRLGGRVQVHDQRPPARPLPLEIDRREYESAVELVKRLAEHAREQGCTWFFYFDGEEIGEVAPPGPDRGIVEGLLGEWKRSLDGKRG